MIPDGPIATFLAQLCAALRLGRRRADRILAEVEDHLLETAESLQARGLSPEEAERQALARFGALEHLAHGFNTELGTTTEVARMLRILTSFMAIFTSLIAFLIGIHSLFLDVREGGAAWVAQKIVGSTAVVLVGAFTLRHLWSRSSRSDRLIGVLWAGAIGLIPLGIVTVIGTIHLARVTGDWEMYMIAAGAALVCQGILTIWSLWDRTARET